MKLKKWLVSFVGVAVTFTAINYGVPAPIAVQIGNEAAEQLSDG